MANHKGEVSHHSPDNRAPAISSASQVGPAENSDGPKDDGKKSEADRVLQVKVIDPGSHFCLPLELNTAVTLIGGIAVFLAWHQAKSNSLAARAAQMSAQALMTAERAWILVTPTEWNPKVEHFGGAENQFFKASTRCKECRQNPGAHHFFHSFISRTRSVVRTPTRARLRSRNKSQWASVSNSRRV